MRWTSAPAYNGERWKILVPTEPKATMARKREERRAIMEILLDNDLIVKLRSEDGTMPYLDHPNNGVTVRDVAKQIEASYAECIEHLRVLEFQNLVEFYTRDRISKTWFEGTDGNIENFTMTSQEVREQLYAEYDPTDAVRFINEAIDLDLKATGDAWVSTAYDLRHQQYQVKRAC